MSETIPFPAPTRQCRRLYWARHEIEAYKCRLFGLPVLERDPADPIVLVSASQLKAELPFNRTTLGRRIKGRIKGEPTPKIAVRALEGSAA